MKNSLQKAVIFLAACLVPGGEVHAQSLVRVEVNSARPLKAAIDSVEEQIGMPINYEDPRFTASVDVQDVTDQVQSPRQRTANPNVRIIVPKGGALVSVRTPLADTPTIGDALSLLTEIRGQHEASGYPGRFRVRQVGDMVTVDPISVRTLDGSWKSSVAAMDTPVTFPMMKRNAAETLILIAKTLTDSLGIKVGLGRFPMIAFANANVEIGSSDEPAGTVITRLFGQLSAVQSPRAGDLSRYSYRLLYDPGVKYYLLHVHAVTPKMSQKATQPVLRVAPPEGFLVQPQKE
jgi:hypothetical protein